MALSEDTPQQRDDKADTLAHEFNRFKWEVRFYWGLVIVLVLTTG